WAVSDGEPMIVALDAAALGQCQRDVTLVTDRTRELAHVGVPDVAVGEEAVVARGPAALARWNGVRRVRTMLLLAEAFGAMQAALEMATAYAKERHQFGRPIGSFQAVKHHLATDLVAVE